MKDCLEHCIVYNVKDLKATCCRPSWMEKTVQELNILQATLLPPLWKHMCYIPILEYHENIYYKQKYMIHQEPRNISIYSSN